ncbi:MAG: NAD(P)H-binding protein [Prolixibacteraceae bacterium]
MGQVANVIGASGLVGNELVLQLLNYYEFDLVRIFVRRATGIIHSKLEERIIDFEEPETWSKFVRGDVLFSTLGTTIKTAKTRDKQYRVDFFYQYEFAKAAAENDVSTLILVSSMGANARSSVFYSRIKGELEDAVSLLGFKRLIIFRPSILDGKRLEKRTGEKIGLVFTRFITQFIFKRYRPTPVDVLAEKMIRSALYEVNGCHIVEGTGILNE